MKNNLVEISKNALLLLFAVFLSLASIESVLRYFNFPVQSLRPENIYDDILLHRLPSDYPGVDKDGFRNLDVKSHADIVAIGDSHTYGFNVDIDNTLPRPASSTPAWAAPRAGRAAGLEEGAVMAFYRFDPTILREYDIRGIAGETLLTGIPQMAPPG